MITWRRILYHYPGCAAIPPVDITPDEDEVPDEDDVEEISDATPEPVDVSEPVASDSLREALTADREEMLRFCEEVFGRVTAISDRDAEGQMTC